VQAGNVHLPPKARLTSPATPLRITQAQSRKRLGFLFLGDAMTRRSEIQLVSPVAEVKPAQMTDAVLAAFVADGAAKVAVFCEKLKPYYLDLRSRFAKKPRVAKIHGCRTWNEYCETVLDRTKRAVNYFLAGGNPNRSGSRETVSRPSPTFPVTVEIRTTRHSYSSIGYVKKPDATPKVLSVSSLSAPAPQETYTQIQEAVDEIIKELRCGIGAANIDPSERETFRELLAKHLDAFAAELRTK